MQGLLIANENREERERLASFFDDDIEVETTDSVVDGLQGILDKRIQVVVLAGDYDEVHVAKLVPLLKKCNRNLSIILVSNEASIDLLRRIRKEGIFYHALSSAGEEGCEEVKQAVLSAFKNYQARNNEPQHNFKEVSMQRMKTILTSLSLVLLAVGPAMAADTTKTYTSGILVLAFVGFCALLVVMQLIPAVRAFYLMSKESASKASQLKTAAAKKH